MPVLPVGERIYEVGASHPERQLFDCLMPTPHGTTYNAYLVMGSEKTALIDAVDPEKTDILLNNLKESGVTQIDYLITLHTEQDHSGSNTAVLSRYPMARVVGSEKIRDMLETHLHYDPGQVMVIKEGDKLDLGDRTLQFMMIPFAHWPDNMMVYLEEERILFSSDLFGSHYATPKMFATSSAEQRLAAKSYFAEIMMPFRAQISRYTAKVRQLKPRLIAPAHGPVWYDPDVILSRYERWTGDAVKKLVTIPYISMHDSTQVLVERLAVKLSAQGLSVVCRNLGNRPDSLTLETGHFIMDLVDAAAVVLATPTVLGGPHPNMAYAAMIANAVRPKTKFMAMVGSYGWATQAEKTLTALTGNIKAERLPTLLVKGLPTQDDLVKVDELASELGQRIQALPDLLES
ncbi:MAG: FprA family A-type flavoprotein [Ruminococcaceae bacterium]|jgi:flavorubredoxin|nr:FprA family A-type flavoprotein [Oscillospiraceae bacterium]